MQDFFAALRTLVLPYGATSGTRLVLDGVNGAIELYDASNNLVGSITGTGATFGIADAARVEIANGTITVYNIANEVVGTLDEVGYQVQDPITGTYAYLFQLLNFAGVAMRPPAVVGHTVAEGFIYADTDPLGGDVHRPRLVLDTPRMNGQSTGLLFVDGETSDGLQGPRVTVGNGSIVHALLVPRGDIFLNGRSLPRGFVSSASSIGGSAAMAAAGTIVNPPGAGVTITNTDTVSTRRYRATAFVRVNMSAGANGLYRPLVTNAVPASIGTGTKQFVATVAGGAGQVGGDDVAVFTLAPGASLSVQAGALRVAGGSAADTVTSGYIAVDDIGT